VNHFQRRRGVLHAEKIPVAALAEAYGTPLYLYSSATLRRHWRVLDRSLAGIDRLLCYAVKANSNLAVLRLFARLGSGFDIVSGGELHRVRSAGGDVRRVVFSGVGKTDDEIATALSAGIRCLNVESGEELLRVARIAARRKLRAPIALRVNPDVDARTHPYIATGLRETKFGIPVAEARRLYARAVRERSLRVEGVACHIGSQITTLGPFLDALRRVRALAEDLREAGIPVRHLDLGGGLGIPYRAGEGEDPPHPRAYGEALRRGLAGFEGEVHLEPGRVLVGNAGILVTRVIAQKKNGRHRFVVVDAGMNDLVRPSFYGAWHDIEPVAAPAKEQHRCDVVGPVCESSDFLARGRLLPKVAVGDLLAVRTAGAYGFSMASNYNSRPRPAEVLVDGAAALLARRRETHADLVRGEDPSPRPRRFR
jgi:diaminopimelate decarboxylase